MAADRMLHKRAGVGDRTNQLNHLEWRVWTIYQLAADDFGVMPCHEQVLIDAHPCLAKEKRQKLRAALEKLVNVGLLGRFRDENYGGTYVYQRDWQDYQKLEWSQMTTRPCIPPAFLEDCTEPTKRLFATWPGGKRVPPADGERRKRARDEDPTPDVVATESRLSSDGVATGSQPRARVRPKDSDTDSDYRGGVGEGEGERLWQRWRELMAPRVRLSLEPNQFEATKVIEACLKVPDEARRSDALVRFVNLDEAERKRLNVKSLTLGYFVMALPDLVEGGRSYKCQRGHVPPCKDDAECTRRYMDSVRAS